MRRHAWRTALLVALVAVAAACHVPGPTGVGGVAGAGLPGSGSNNPSPAPVPTVPAPTTTPVATVPPTTAPPTTTPDPGPGTTAPVTTAPPTTSPPTTAPPATQPDPTVPDPSVPVTTEPDPTVPETTVPTTTVPPSGPPGCSAYYALTFDDGPTSHTAQLLATLKALDVRATFFVTGEHAEQDPERIAGTLAAGHEIGDHSWSHVDMTTLVGTGLIDGEIGGTADYLRWALGAPPITWFRPPFGATNDGVRAVEAQHGLSEVIWSLDTNDWDGRSAAAIAETALQATAGDIVLMHDGYTNTIEALPVIVEGLRAKGLCAGRIVPSSTPVTAWPGLTYHATAGAW